MANTRYFWPQLPVMAATPELAPQPIKTPKPIPFERQQKIATAQKVATVWRPGVKAAAEARRKKVSVQGKQYDSIQSAAIALGCSEGTVNNHCRDRDYPDWFFVI